MALNGTNGDDFFLGTIFADEVFGLDGDDIASASPGADTIDGGGIAISSTMRTSR